MHSAFHELTSYIQPHGSRTAARPQDRLAHCVGIEILDVVIELSTCQAYQRDEHRRADPPTRFNPLVVERVEPRVECLAGIWFERPSVSSDGDVAYLDSEKVTGNAMNRPSRACRWPEPLLRGKVAEERAEVIEERRKEISRLDVEHVRNRRRTMPGAAGTYPPVRSAIRPPLIGVLAIVTRPVTPTHPTCRSGARCLVTAVIRMRDYGPGSVAPWRG